MCEIGLLLGARKERTKTLNHSRDSCTMETLGVTKTDNNYVQRKKQFCVEVNILCFKLSTALGDFAALQVSYPVLALWSKCTLVKMHMILMITDSHNMHLAADAVQWIG